jgi:hypothetical protein
MNDETASEFDSNPKQFDPSEEVVNPKLNPSPNPEF